MIARISELQKWLLSHFDITQQLRHKGYCVHEVSKVKNKYISSVLLPRSSNQWARNQWIRNQWTSNQWTFMMEIGSSTTKSALACLMITSMLAIKVSIWNTWLVGQIRITSRKSKSLIKTQFSDEYLSIIFINNQCNFQVLDRSNLL